MSAAQAEPSDDRNNTSVVHVITMGMPNSFQTFLRQRSVSQDNTRGARMFFRSEPPVNASETEFEEPEGQEPTPTFNDESMNSIIAHAIGAMPQGLIRALCDVPGHDIRAFHILRGQPD